MNALDFTIAYARRLELPSGEMKWAKISASKLNVYKLVLDRFFDLPQARDSISFHSLVVDTSKIRDDLYNDGDRELGFNKEVHQRCCDLMFARSTPTEVRDRVESLLVDGQKSTVSAIVGLCSAGNYTND